METTSTSLGGGLLPSTQPACLIFVKPEGGTMNFNSVSVAKTALLHQGVKRNRVRRFHCEKALAVVHVSLWVMRQHQGNRERLSQHRGDAGGRLCQSARRDLGMFLTSRH